MKSLRSIAIEYGVHYQTVRKWVKTLGLPVSYLKPERGGMLATLDDGQEKQLKDWLKTRANEHQYKTTND